MLLTLEEDKWHELKMDLDTLDDDGTVTVKGKDWSCYWIDIDGEKTEIPFWAMDPFADFYDELSTKVQKQEIVVEYRRSEDRKGLNTAEFRGA